MSTDIDIRIEGRAGRITLNRPKALNALSYDMCLRIDAALKAWAVDDQVALLIIDAAGDKAFCAGGDIAEMYATGSAGDYAYGRQFWADEYRMNARLFGFGKPVITFLQGFVMGGGVGVGCHGSHRIVCDSSQIAMPECGIGLVPDVGGSLILARAPGRLGEYLGTTGARMGPGDAIHVGFADYYIPETDWDALKTALIDSGDPAHVDQAAQPAPDAPLKAAQAEIDRLFEPETLSDILPLLEAEGSAFSQKTLHYLRRNAPLSIACAVELIHRARSSMDNIQYALGLEYRFTFRAMEHADFIEGIRAAIIDKDRNPQWRHARAEDVALREVSALMMPLGAEALRFND